MNYPNETRQNFSPLLQTFGNNVRVRRKAVGLTQEGLAERAGLHRTYVADVERGSRNISLINVAKIARAFGISVSELCEAMR
jgi:transcriptional regulator with XRE-family HTH domain